MSFSIAHFTTLHSRDDTRITLKELASLAAANNYSITLFVQDGLGDGNLLEGRVSVRDTGRRSTNRLIRAIVGNFRMWRALRLARPTLAHFHDPELIVAGLLLKVSGMKIIYDIHEDLPRQIRAMAWIPAWLRSAAAAGAQFFEWLACLNFDRFVAATPPIARRFPPRKTVVVQNFPLPDELVTPDFVPMSRRPPVAAYVGGLSIIRGAREMVQALARVPASCEVRLEFAGVFAPTSLRASVAQLAGWERVVERGWLDRQAIAGLFAQARMGLVLFHPVPNHVEAQPNKLFEYMSAGLPVIASDFPLWREIVGGCNCGILVDPLEPAAIADAMTWILSHPGEAQTMGSRGQRAVESRFSWPPEGRKLNELYSSLHQTLQVSA